MAAIADFRVLDVDLLDDLKDSSVIHVKKGLFKKSAIDNYWTFLDAKAEKLDPFNKSGFIFGHLLVFLQENKKIDLLSSEFDSLTNWISEKRNCSTLIFTFDHKEKYLHQLNADDYSLEELIEFNIDFSEESNPELAEAEKEGITAIRNALTHLNNSSQVVLLTVG